MEPWYKVADPSELASPALLVYPERVRRNIAEMVRIAGAVERLRPHVKTHKCREIIHLQQSAGIHKYKCATVAEAEMLAGCGAGDVLLAYQPCGPAAKRYLQLVVNYPEVIFSALVDNSSTADELDRLSGEAGICLGLFIDVDAGMHRTGMAPGKELEALSKKIKHASNLTFRGWHLYDGHIRDTDFNQRRKNAEASYQKVISYISEPEAYEIIAGGSPTLPVHAMNPQLTLSPGTTLFWDQGYSQKFPDMNFLPSAVLITRVISKPGGELLCLDIGHKALASEMPHPRVYLPELGQVEFLTHSEEHLVLRSPKASEYKVGDVLYGIPMHICPTTALHQELVVIEEGKETARWQVFARDRRITV